MTLVAESCTPTGVAPAEAVAVRGGRGLSAGVLAWAARRILAGSKRRLQDLSRTTDATEYCAWRARELRGQLREHFPVEQIAGRNVLDFACGTGELSAILAEHAPRGIVGVDVSLDAIRAAQGAFESLRPGGPQSQARPVQTEVEFRHAGDANRIPVADASVDLIGCFDALEHLAHPAETCAEWHRVLRPGGRIWIWWSPWRGPYGHHLDSLIPIPWVHLILSERTLFRACAAVYDSPEFTPRKWDIEAATGSKKPNKWRRTTSFHPFLNRLTRHLFERYAAEAGLTITQRRTVGFRGSRIKRMTRLMLPLPALGECFVSYYTYVLTRT